MFVCRLIRISVAVVGLAWLAASGFLPAPTALAWDQHHLVTRASLSDLPHLRSQTVRYASWDRLVKDLGFSSLREFNESLQIRKQYAFAPKLGEGEGAAVPLLEVLAAYSDEPDWGMDKEIFGEYPKIWEEKYSRMGGREGTPSQAFRHMYWPGLSWRMPLRTFKLPLGQLFSSMGLAPERAALFMDLSRQARKAGHPYWSARFLANALHYLEDAASPFHAAQTPTKQFAWMPIGDPENGKGAQNYLLQVQNITAYYHYAFERYIGHLLEAHSAEENSAEGKEFVRALAGMVPGRATAATRGATIADLVVELAHFSVNDSARAGKTSIAFFPKIENRFDRFDPEQSVNSDAWWEKTLRNGKRDSATKQEYFAIVKEMFSRLGAAVRAVIEIELPGPLRAREERGRLLTRAARNRLSFLRPHSTPSRKPL